MDNVSINSNCWCCFWSFCGQCLRV